MKRGSQPMHSGAASGYSSRRHLERRVAFALDDDPTLIAERVRETLE
jgi:hypothetical protein